MMSELFIIIGVVLTLIVGFGTPIIGAAMWAESIQCHNRLDGMKVNGYWKVFGGCFAETETGSHVPLAYWRGLQEIKLKVNQ